MLNLIDTIEYNDWWIKLNAIENKLNMVKTSKSNNDLLIDVQDYSVLINSINAIKTNEYGKYYNNWSNYPVEQVGKGKVVKEQKIGELLLNLTNHLCGNIVSARSESNLTSKYSVENIQEKCVFGTIDCSHYSTTTYTNSNGCGDVITSDPTYGITTTYGTDGTGCSTGCNTGEFLAHGQNSNYGTCHNCSHVGTRESTYGKVTTGRHNCITETTSNSRTYTGYSVNV